MSAGKEAVLVQWHLEKQERGFVSRVGNAIVNFSLSPTYYAMTLADNTVKVVRIDNNKTVLAQKVLQLTPESQMSSFDKKLIVPTGTKIQVYDMDEDHRGIQIIDVKPRNYVSNATVENLPESKVIAHTFTPNKQTLLSVDALEDP